MIKSENDLKWSAIKILYDNVKKLTWKLFVKFWKCQIRKNDALILPIFGYKTLFKVPVLYHINLNGFFTLHVKEIKITIWDAELVFSTGLQSGGTPGVI